MQGEVGESRAARSAVMVQPLLATRSEDSDGRGTKLTVAWPCMRVNTVMRHSDRQQCEGRGSGGALQGTKECAASVKGGVCPALMPISARRITGRILRTRAGARRA